LVLGLAELLSHLDNRKILFEIERDPEVDVRKIDHAALLGEHEPETVKASSLDVGEQLFAESIEVSRRKEATP
jgi:hypothetical protein